MRDAAAALVTGPAATGSQLDPRTPTLGCSFGNPHYRPIDAANCATDLLRAFTAAMVPTGRRRGRGADPRPNQHGMLREFRMRQADEHPQ